MTNEQPSLPADLEAAHAAILAQWNARRQAEAIVTAASLEIQRLKLLLAKARRQAFGQTSERAARLLDQLELQLSELEATAAEDEVAAEAEAASAGTPVAGHVRQKPARRPLPAHLPRERVVVPAPTSCPCCGGTRLSKVGEVVTETLDVIPRRWFVRQTVREKFSCRDCERISEPPAPFHVIPRGRIGASLLAMILFEKYGQHQPLNRQSERYAREGVDLDLSTLADLVGTATAVLAPLHELIRRHVLAAERLHGDDTPVPVLAKGRTATGRLWAYARDDRPFGRGEPAVLFHYSPDRRGEHPERHLAGYAGILQADAYAGFGRLYAPTRPGGAVTEALCWAHARRGFFELADLSRTRKGPPSPLALALEAVRRIDAIFNHERAINGHLAEERLAYRQANTAPLVGDLEAWMRAERPRLSRHVEVAKAMDYMLKRWPAFTRFLKDGRVCLSNNAAERALRGIALGRKAWLFCGSDRGGERAAVLYTMIGTAKLNDIDPPGLARGRPRADRSASDQPAVRAAALALDPRRSTARRLIRVRRHHPTARSPWDGYLLPQPTFRTTLAWRHREVAAIKDSSPQRWTSGDVYEPFMGRWSRLVAREFLAWLNAPAGLAWLDVGCGTGALTEAVAAGCAPERLAGVDSSAALLDFAQRHLGVRAELRQGDAQDLPFTACEFDWVVSGLLLNFVPDQPRAAAELARVARPDGEVALYVWDYAGKMELMRHVWDAAAALDPRAAELDLGKRSPICQPEALRQLFEGTGMLGVEARAIDVPTVFRDFDDYWTPFLRGQAPTPTYCRSLGDDARAELRERLRRDLPARPDGSIHLTARAWVVRGRKS